MPSVSVILSTYNRASLLGRMVDSVLAQTHQDFELLVVDDASADNTVEVARAFSDPRIHYIRLPENRGVGNARNVGIQQAGAPIIAFADDDDTLHPDFLATTVKAFLDAPPNVGFLWTWKNKVIYEQDEEKILRQLTFNVTHPTILSGKSYFGTLAGGTNGLVVRAHALNQVGGFDARFRAAGDTELLIRLAKQYDYMVIPQALYNYIQVGEGQLTAGSLTRAQALELICDEHEQILRKYPGTYQRLCTRSAKMYYQFGDTQSGRRMMRRLPGVFPPRLRSYALWMLLEFKSLTGRART